MPDMAMICSRIAPHFDQAEDRQFGVVPGDTGVLVDQLGFRVPMNDRPPR